MADHHFSGFIYALSGATLFSLKPVLIKLAYAHGIDTVTLMTLRMMIALPFYVAVGLWVFLRRQHSTIDFKNNIVPTMLIGVLGYYLASYFDLLGLTLITAQLERLILFTYPTMVVVLGAVFFHQPVSNKIWVALLLTYTGVASIVAHDMSSLGSKVINGAALVLVSALCFSLFMLLSKVQILQIGSRLYTSIAMSAASIAIISHFSLTQSFDQLIVSNDVLLIVFGIAFISTVLPSFLISAAISSIGPGQTSLIGSVGPMFTAMLAVIVLGEEFTRYHALGMALVLAGVAQLRSKGKHSKVPHLTTNKK
ncbi:MAG: DMT family transporter [Methylococcales bacterium]